MSLLFDADAERVDHGSGASIDDLPAGGACTILVWLNRNAAGGNQHVLTMDGTVFATRAGVVFLTDNSGGSEGQARALVRRVGGTDTDYVTSTVVAPLDAWAFLAMVFDDGGGAGEIINVYYGSLAALAVEASYGTATDGSGTITADAANAKWVGNLERASGNEFKGRIARLGYYNAALTLGQVQRLQFAPVSWWNLSSCKLLADYYSTAYVHDLTGNGNTGTVSGATTADHVPLGPPLGQAVYSPWTLGGWGRLLSPHRNRLVRAA